MLIAGSVSLSEVLASLANRRPVFHSEADFQFALAWEVQMIDREIEVYLETRPMSGVHLDLAFEKGGNYTALELKYLTRAWTGLEGVQRYELKNHSAQDLRRYDVVKDIVRVEKFTGERQSANGAVVILTNDPSYRRAPAASSTANDLAFRIGDGVTLEGVRRWRQTPVGVGDRPDLELANRYELEWAVFSTFGGDSTLWQLVIEVPNRIADASDK